MMTSSRPSPFTSPAAETLYPLLSLAPTPLITKPPPPSASRVESSIALVDSVPKTTYEAPEFVPFGSA